LSYHINIPGVAFWLGLAGVGLLVYGWKAAVGVIVFALLLTFVASTVIEY
jgi:hypothetical protein